MHTDIAVTCWKTTPDVLLPNSKLLTEALALCLVLIWGRSADWLAQEAGLSRHKATKLYDYLLGDLTVGLGIPTAGHLHEIARRIGRSAAIVCVEIDPIMVARLTVQDRSFAAGRY